jgi:hypothetical protein
VNIKFPKKVTSKHFKKDSNDIIINQIIIKYIQNNNNNQFRKRIIDIFLNKKFILNNQYNII